MDSFRTLFFAKCIDKNNKEGRVAEGSSIILKHKISVKGKNADLAPRRAHFALYCRTILCITIIIDDVQLLNTHSVYTTKKKRKKKWADAQKSGKSLWKHKTSLAYGIVYPKEINRLDSPSIRAVSLLHNYRSTFISLYKIICYSRYTKNLYIFRNRHAS